MTVNIPAPVRPTLTDNEEINIELENIYGYLVSLAATLNRTLPTLSDSGDTDTLSESIAALTGRVEVLETAGNE